MFILIIRWILGFSVLIVGLINGEEFEKYIGYSGFFVVLFWLM